MMNIFTLMEQIEREESIYEMLNFSMEIRALRAGCIPMLQVQFSLGIHSTPQSLLHAVYCMRPPAELACLLNL